MMCMVNDYLDYTLLSRNQFDSRVGRLEVRPVIKAVLESFKLFAEAKRLQFKLSIDFGVPTILLTDRQRLLQVLRNYVGNALKYTTTGKIHVRVAYSETDKQVILEVEDTGVGIKEENIKKLFKPFT